jgi:AcrR family transcriptional regulator
MAVPTALSGREALLEAGRELFLVHGYNDVSMQQIAEAAGMTKGAPYYHFKNKDELFMEVFHSEMQRIELAFKEQLEAEGPLRDRLIGALAVTINTTQSDLARLFTDVEHCVGATFAKDEQARIRKQANMVDKLRPYFEEAAAKGEITHRAPEQATFLFVMSAMAIMQWLRFDEWRTILGTTPDEVAKTLVDTLFEGF